MEPIISPWLIYLLGFWGSFEVAVCLVIVICGIVALVYWVIGLCAKHSDYGTDDENKEKAAWAFGKQKRILVLTVILFAVSIILPSRDTIIGMIVAKNITKDNIAEAIRIGKSMKDEVKSDLADVIRMIANGGEKDE